MYPQAELEQLDALRMQSVNGPRPPAQDPQQQQYQELEQSGDFTADLISFTSKEDLAPVDSASDVEDAL